MVSNTNTLTYTHTVSHTAQVLRKVSMVIGAGETIAIVGPSGSGKSTLARFLYRLHDPTHGSVEVFYLFRYLNTCLCVCLRVCILCISVGGCILCMISVCRYTGVTCTHVHAHTHAQIHEVDLQEATLASVRRVVGVVPHDTVLFQHTVHYNIACAN